MSSKLGPTSRLLAAFALATLNLATVAKAQPYGQGGGGMMGGDWGWGRWVGEWVASEGSAGF
jgi:hypothetical protein